MRLKKASFAFAGTVTAVVITTMAASPALACNDRDPALQLKSMCAHDGASWMVTNPNTWGSVPFTWSDDQGGHSDGYVQAPPGASVAVPSHAMKVVVVAYRPDRDRGTIWEKHGAAGTADCKTAPTPTPSAPASKTPTAKPTTAKPTPTTAPPSGEARPATPVKEQPQFTG